MRADLRPVVALVLVAAGVAAPPAHATRVEQGPDAEVACAFPDDAILESSGLALVAGTLVTVNDSGDGARVFALDPETCATNAVIPWPGDAVDVEALAPGASGHVWVGDIGDNRRARQDVGLVDLPLDGAPARTYRAAYAGGQAHDAEALLRHPTTGRLYVVTKDVFAGEVYAAPSALTPDGVNRLAPLGQVTGIVTDGAFLPDGRHLVLRTYTRAVVYSFPGLEEVASFDLPEQQQGEGLAVEGEEEILLSSEGRAAEVLRVRLPDEVVEAIAENAEDAEDAETAGPSAPVEGGGADDASDPAAEDDGDAWADSRPALPWFLGGFLGLAALLVLARALRPR